MKIVRQTNPEVCFALIPWFVPNQNQNVLEIGAELYQRMIDKPDDTLVLTALNGEYCEGVLISYVDADHVHIFQARKARDFQYPRLMFAKTMEWAKAKGFNKLTLGCEDKRLRRMYKTKYGFVSSGGVYMERSI